ncbi:MAG: TIGR04076 family protein [Candidatus Thorarchaeota archaeon]|nr:MAG: TIGR04076 family protein [Candidatus Thorarchaeota archaeon]
MDFALRKTVDVAVMVRYKLKIEVIDVLGNGKCSMGQKAGDAYEYPEDRGKMCPSAFHVMYPWILVMLSGGKFSWMEDDSITLGCSDYTHQVVFKITRRVIEE